MFNLLKTLFGGGKDLKEWFDRGAIIVDVRSPAEFSGGHPDGAINVPLPELAQRMKTLKQRNKPVIACCASGNRSSTATSMLQAAGIEAVNGGSWQQVEQARQQQ